MLIVFGSYGWRGPDLEVLGVPPLPRRAGVSVRGAAPWRGPTESPAHRVHRGAPGDRSPGCASWPTSAEGAHGTPTALSESTLTPTLSVSSTCHPHAHLLRLFHLPPNAKTEWQVGVGETEAGAGEGSVFPVSPFTCHPHAHPLPLLHLPPSLPPSPSLPLAT